MKLWQKEVSQILIYETNRASSYKSSNLFTKIRSNIDCFIFNWFVGDTKQSIYYYAQ